MEFVYSGGNASSPVAFVSFGAMHTVFEIVLVHVEESHARSLADKVEALVLGLDRKLNRHDEDSVFYRINALSGNESTVVDDDVFSVLHLCEVFRKGTMGYFDISALSVVPVHPAYQLDPGPHSVSLCAEGVVLDAGGFGKGYALDRVRAFLSENGVRDALLNFGDSSVAAMGTHPFGDCWDVGIVSGGTPFRLKDMSLSVSGCRPDGQEHILDPVAHRLSCGGGLVAVEGRSAFVCEVLSTALYAAPPEERNRIIREFEDYRYKEIRQDISSWIEENL